MDPITTSIISLVGGWGPMIIFAVSFIIGFVIKDLLTTFAYSLMFYLDKDFVEGDNVIVDGELATIINIKLTRTIFRMAKNGNWRYVHNSKIRYLKLEKVKEPKDEDFKVIHNK